MLGLRQDLMAPSAAGAVCCLPPDAAHYLSAVKNNVMHHAHYCTLSTAAYVVITDVHHADYCSPRATIAPASGVLIKASVICLGSIDISLVHIKIVITASCESCTSSRPRFLCA